MILRCVVTSGGGESGAVISDQVAFWVGKWKDQKTSWHLNHVNKHLLRFEHLLRGEKDAPARILVPLCGKSIDMKWLYAAGHTVIGVEAAVLPVEEFFRENNVKHVQAPAPSVDGVVYQTEDSRLKIYVCDLFKFRPETEGRFEAIWDRASLSALLPPHTTRYAQLMKQLVGQNFSYLLTVMELAKPDESYTGFPALTYPAELQQLFGDVWTIKCLTAEPYKFPGGTDDYIEKVYVLSSK